MIFLKTFYLPSSIKLKTRKKFLIRISFRFRHKIFCFFIFYNSLSVFADSFQVIFKKWSSKARLFGAILQKKEFTVCAHMCTHTLLCRKGRRRLEGWSIAEETTNLCYGISLLYGWGFLLQTLQPTHSTSKRERFIFSLSVSNLCQSEKVVKILSHLYSHEASHSSLGWMD